MAHARCVSLASRLAAAVELQGVKSVKFTYSPFGVPQHSKISNLMLKAIPVLKSNAPRTHFECIKTNTRECVPSLVVQMNSGEEKKVVLDRADLEAVFSDLS
eukprot:m.73911 g.73911  ORF g.73911 m.73911 type:complete len:102 (-) comp20385_c0_seq1:285-590(-)